MKKLCVAGLLMFVVVDLRAAKMEPDCNGVYHCPAGLNPTSSNPDPNDWNACDPAFITQERTWTSLKQVAVNASGAKDQTGTKISTPAEVEQALIKALDEAKAPDRAWLVAMEAWRTGVSAELQRQALAQVRSMTKASSEGETLTFMLSALENPAAEMERCRELGRGTAFERKKAADRLALLLQNPNLADRLK